MWPTFSDVFGKREHRDSVTAAKSPDIARFSAPTLCTPAHVRLVG